MILDLRTGSDVADRTKLAHLTFVRWRGRGRYILRVSKREGGHGVWQGDLRAPHARDGVLAERGGHGEGHGGIAAIPFSRPIYFNFFKRFRIPCLRVTIHLKGMCGFMIESTVNCGCQPHDKHNSGR